VGRKEALEEVLDEVEGRPLVGAAALRIVRARQAHWLMVHKPDEAYQGGAVAIDRILMSFHGGRRLDYRIPEARSSLRGMSLAQLDELAEVVGLEMQVAKRDHGAEVLSPAVLHRKGNQFWALLREEGGRYLVQDPTFAGDLWVSREVLEYEASGSFLLPAGSLPSGWTPLGRGEGQDVWGTGRPSAEWTCLKYPSSDRDGTTHSTKKEKAARDLLELPPLLHRQAEADRRRGARGALHPPTDGRDHLPEAPRDRDPLRRG
jgi:hypothetical protein